MNSRCGLNGVIVALVEEVVIRGGLWSFKSPNQTQWLFLFLLPQDPEEELSVTSPALCLPTCYHVSCHDDNGLNFWNCKPAPMKYLPLEELLWLWCLFTAIEHGPRHRLRMVNWGKAPPVQAWGSHHPCWVKCFWFSCIEISHTLQVSPSPLSVSKPGELIGLPGSSLMDHPILHWYLVRLG